MPVGSKWWQRPSMGQLAGPQPGRTPPGVPLGQAAPFAPFSPTRPLDAAPASFAGRLGAWFPDEAELRTWGGVGQLSQVATIDKGEHPALRLVQARFPVPLPVLLSVGATDGALSSGLPWLNCPITFRVQIGVAAGQHQFPFAVQTVPLSGVFTLSGQLAARSIIVDAFFSDVTAVDISANVWAGVAPFG